MTMRNIYVVMATNGEYSDREEWTVAAYESEADAKLHVERGEACEREMEGRRRAAAEAAGDAWYDYRPSEMGMPSNPYHGASHTYGEYDTRMFVCAVPVLSAVPNHKTPKMPKVKP